MSKQPPVNQQAYDDHIAKIDAATLAEAQARTAKRKLQQDSNAIYNGTALPSSKPKSVNTGAVIRLCPSDMEAAVVACLDSVIDDSMADILTARESLMVAAQADPTITNKKEWVDTTYGYHFDGMDKVMREDTIRLHPVLRTLEQCGRLNLMKNAVTNNDTRVYSKINAVRDTCYAVDKELKHDRLTIDSFRKEAEMVLMRQEINLLKTQVAANTQTLVKHGLTDLEDAIIKAKQENPKSTQIMISKVVGCSKAKASTTLKKVGL